jgi:hypothetical protein
MARNDETLSPVTAENGLLSIDRRCNGLDVNPDRSGGHVKVVSDSPEQIRGLLDGQIAGELPPRMRAMHTRAASGRTGRRAGVVYSDPTGDTVTG